MKSGMGYVALARAIIEFARRDVRKMNRHYDDAVVFLASDWCKCLQWMIGFIEKPGREDCYE